MSNKINCLVVDDEPIARQIIENYCSHLPVLHIAGSCANALEAKAILQSRDIQLIFLDINMPVLDGMAFLKTIKNPPQIIFTTAYKEFALEAFDLAACDYLLKPFSLERFIVAVDKALERLQVPVAGKEEKEEKFIFIKAEGKIYQIPFSELLFAEASGNYTKVVTTQQTLLPGMTFSSIEELLPASLFIRIHRSFIINRSRITHIEGNRVFIGKHELPIGSNYKEPFLKALGV